MTTEVVCRLGAQWRMRSRYLMVLSSFRPPPTRFRNGRQRLLCTAPDGKKLALARPQPWGFAENSGSCFVRKKHSNRSRHGVIGLNMASQFEQMQQQIEDLKAIVAKQGQFNQDVPEHATKRDQPRFRTYKRRNTKTESHTKSGLRGRRNLFPASMVSTGCDEPHSSYVTNTTLKIARARALQQKFMQLRHLDSNFMAEDVGSKIPKGMPVSFQPTPDMEIDGLHLATASYIFNTALDPEEILVPNSHCAMTRKALRTLEPGRQVVDDMLILLARMLALDSTRLQCK